PLEGAATRRERQRLDEELALLVAEVAPGVALVEGLDGGSGHLVGVGPGVGELGVEVGGVVGRAVAVEPAHVAAAGARAGARAEDRRLGRWDARLGGAALEVAPGSVVARRGRTDLA